MGPVFGSRCRRIAPVVEWRLVRLVSRLPSGLEAAVQAMSGAEGPASAHPWVPPADGCAALRRFDQDHSSRVSGMPERPSGKGLTPSVWWIWIKFSSKPLMLPDM